MYTPLNARSRDAAINQQYFDHNWKNIPNSASGPAEKLLPGPSQRYLGRVSSKTAQFVDVVVLWMVSPANLSARSSEMPGRTPATKKIPSKERSNK